MKQGGAFGIHLLFSSQTFQNCDIAPDTLSNMRLRISYRLAYGVDCRAILSGDNDEPLYLERFQLVYNTEYGRKDGNIIVKADNFERGNIIPLLKKATEKHKGCKQFKKKIITEEDNSNEEETNQKNNNIFDIKSVKQDTNDDENYEGWDNDLAGK